MRTINSLISSIKPDNVLFLSPHQDDIAFSMAETFSQFGKMGIPGHLSVVFSESLYTVKRSLPRNQSVPRLRYAEDKAFIRDFYPICEYKTLGHQSAMERDSLKNPRVKQTAKKTDIALRNIVADQIRDSLNNADIIFLPLGLGFHLDHLLLREAVLHAGSNKEFPKLVFYEDLPYCGENTNKEIEEIVNRFSYQLPQPLIKLQCRIKDVPARVEICKRYYPSQENKGTLRNIEKHLRRTSRYPSERLWGCL